MKELSFYKEFYFFEIKRKDEIEKRINLPIIVMTIVVSIHAFIFSSELSENFRLFAIVISCINLLLIILITLFLLKSYSNLYKSHWYKELANMEDILNFENELIQEANPNFKEIRDNYLISELANCSTVNFKLNKDRTEAIAKAKIYMFITIILTAFLSIVYIVNLI